MFLFGSIVLTITEWIAPNFYNYPYFYKGVTLRGILAYWPLFIYAAVMAYISSRRLRSTLLDEKILVLSTLTSVFAGVWEELGFRWVFICSSMIALVVANFIWSSFLAVIFGAILVIIGFLVSVSGNKRIGERLAGLLGMILGLGLACLFFYSSDPIYWLYDRLIVPAVNVVTLGFFKPYLYNPAIPKLFVLGMLAANFKFSDGHKYQGPIGQLNSWIIGLIMMGAMLTYGLWTAVFLHVVYDIEFSVIHYVFRKTDAL